MRLMPFDLRTLCIFCVAFITLCASSEALAAEPPALAKARSLYNAGDYEGAIDAAAVARRQPQAADAAALVIARAHIERYRQSAMPADLAAAREALGSVRSAALAPRDQVDLIVGLGQALYLGEVYGAAAELFDAALDKESLLAAGERVLLLDWWATALDREAQTRVFDRRAPVYQRIADRMEREVRQDPGNATANYWLAVAVRGAGDLDRAWSAAIAAWVRSSLNRDETDKLRVDIDRLVSQALIPERARTRQTRDSQDAVDALRAEWELVKEHWK